MLTNNKKQVHNNRVFFISAFFLLIEFKKILASCAYAKLFSFFPHWVLLKNKIVYLVYCMYSKMFAFPFFFNSFISYFVSF